MLLRDIAACKYTLDEVVKRIDEVLAQYESVVFMTSVLSVGRGGLYDVAPMKRGNVTLLLLNPYIAIHVPSCVSCGLAAVVRRIEHGHTIERKVDADDTLEETIMTLLRV
jgi:hypothetical protein